VTRHHKTQTITVAVLAAAAGAIALGRAGWRVALPAKSNPAPQDAIYAMLDAAREGRVADYLAAFAGPMEAALKQTIAESTEAGFARYLRETNAPVKGIAINEPQPVSDGEVRARVEYVYEDRNEAQWMHLVRSGRGWRIQRVDAAERVQTLIPYGTPVK
jgi:hypothetical protein